MTNTPSMLPGAMCFRRSKKASHPTRARFGKRGGLPLVEADDGNDDDEAIDGAEADARATLANVLATRSYRSSTEHQFALIPRPLEVVFCSSAAACAAAHSPVPAPNSTLTGPPAGKSTGNRINPLLSSTSALVCLASRVEAASPPLSCFARTAAALSGSACLERPRDSLSLACRLTEFASEDNGGGKSSVRRYNGPRSTAGNSVGSSCS